MQIMDVNQSISHSSGMTSKQERLEWYLLKIQSLENVLNTAYAKSSAIEMLEKRKQTTNEKIEKAILSINKSICTYLAKSRRRSSHIVQKLKALELEGKSEMQNLQKVLVEEISRLRTAKTVRRLPTEPTHKTCRILLERIRHDTHGFLSIQDLSENTDAFDGTLINSPLKKNPPIRFLARIKYLQSMNLANNPHIPNTNKAEAYRYGKSVNQTKLSPFLRSLYAEIASPRILGENFKPIEKSSCLAKSNGSDMPDSTFLSACTISWLLRDATTCLVDSRIYFNLNEALGEFNTSDSEPSSLSCLQGFYVVSDAAPEKSRKYFKVVGRSGEHRKSRKENCKCRNLLKSYPDVLITEDCSNSCIYFAAATIGQLKRIIRLDENEESDSVEYSAFVHKFYVHCKQRNSSRPYVLQLNDDCMRVLIQIYMKSRINIPEILEDLMAKLPFHFYLFDRSKNKDSKEQVRASTCAFDTTLASPELFIVGSPNGQSEPSQEERETPNEKSLKIKSRDSTILNHESLEEYYPLAIELIFGQGFDVLSKYYNLFCKAYLISVLGEVNTIVKNAVFNDNVAISLESAQMPLEYCIFCELNILTKILLVERSVHEELKRLIGNGVFPTRELIVIRNIRRELERNWNSFKNSKNKPLNLSEASVDLESGTWKEKFSDDNFKALLDKYNELIVAKQVEMSNNNSDHFCRNKTSRTIRPALILELEYALRKYFILRKMF